MASCPYCGRPCGFLKKQHPECHEKHQRAISMIPGFFSRILDNSISPEKFTTLLHDAAAASYVDPDELKSLAIEGLSKLIISILERRLLSPGEEQRIVEIATGLGPHFAEESRLDETLEKMQILRDLSDGRIPDRAPDSGKLPIKVRLGETILWIVDGVRHHRQAPPQPDPVSAIAMVPGAGTYCGLGLFTQELVQAKQQPGSGLGDLILTNHNIHFCLRSKPLSRVPISRITGIHPYANGVDVRFQRRSWRYILPDPWFITNAIVLLLALTRR